jgi:DNA-binding helix-hairpin-helix protein with protein kinase domain
MQFTDAAGRQFLCGVGRPEFSAPELAELNLRHQPRDTASDLFALAVHIHLLLMNGNHPFLRGSWTGSGEQPDAMTLARNGHWASGPDSQLRTHPLAPPPTFLPDAIQQLFVRAFTDGARDPRARPPATEWRRALLAIRVKQCPRLHDVPVETEVCPWCLIDDERARRRSERDAGEPVPVQIISNIGAIGPAQTPATPMVTPWTAQPSASNTQPWWSWRGIQVPRRTILVALATFVLLALIVVGLTALSVGDNVQVKLLPMQEPVHPDLQPTGLPSVVYPCPGGSAGRYRHSAAELSTMCEFATDVLRAANASPAISRGEAATIPTPNRGWGVADSATCAPKQQLMVCRGGPTVVELW